MYLEEVFVANGTAVVIEIILLICRLMTRGKHRYGDVCFIMLICIGITCAIAETVSFYVDGNSDGALRIINFAINTLLYSCTATVSVLWVFYTDLKLNNNPKRLKTVFAPMVIFWAALIGLLVGNIFGQYLFSIDANNVYKREPMGYTFYVFLLISFVVSIVLYVKRYIQHGRAQFFPIWMFLSPVIASVIIQALYYGISLAWLGCAIGLTGLYINVQSKMSMVDCLTQIYNRTYIEHKLVSMKMHQKAAYCGIMLDIDYFKEINDTFGHSIGDEALEEAASLLVKATDRNSIPFRFAGDEFIIIVREKNGDLNKLEERAIEIENRVREETKNFNNSYRRPYRIEFSMGHCIYDKKLPDDDFFRSMDEAMYKEKEAHHRGYKEHYFTNIA